MPLSWNEIRDRSVAFARDWQGVDREQAEAQTFWNEFFKVFGIERKRVAAFEQPVKALGDRAHKGGGRIDLFWKGTLLVEHKSRGKDLDRAFVQAMDYFPGIVDRDLPRFVLVSDFARFRLYDLEADTEHEFALKDFPRHIKRFGFIAGYAPQEIKPQDPVNIRAAEKMGRLHDQLKASGYVGHDLEVLLVRLVFCLFADDTGIFPAQSFREWVESRTAEDGSDLGPQLAQLFQVLDTPDDRRQKTLDEQLCAFPYVNGNLFSESLRLAAFDAKMRAALLDCCALDWGGVSPAIFGALFQSIMDAKARRNLGAHYTSEENILKLIKPLFLDELWAEFGKVRNNKNRLFEFHKKLRTLTFLDPACGCGNFLVITYRELRLLELEVLRVAAGGGQQFVDVFGLVRVDVDQFHGIEIEEFPVQIAQLAMWLVDHQMNQKVSEEFGMYFARIPLKSSPHIVHGNALRVDWNEVVSAERVSYVMGNPPFIGHQNRSQAQIAEMNAIWGGGGRFGRLDYVACWYRLATSFMARSTIMECAFVSTNSICQGEQVGILWGWLLSQGVRIRFAHRSFQWGNEARGVAAVHCVIIGFGLGAEKQCHIYDYGENPRGNATRYEVGRINPYLVDAPDLILPSRSDARPGYPRLTKGSQPTDGGHFFLSGEERKELIKSAPQSERWIKRFLGGEELLNNVERYCLWLKDISPGELRHYPKIMERVAKVRETRLRSSTESVRQFADKPTLFTQDRQPSSAYLALSRHSSETRRFLPIAFVMPDVIAGDALVICPGANHFHFGVMSSSMHMAWVRFTCGRLESRLRYEASVYNNFPWPDQSADGQVTAIKSAAQGVLDARAHHLESSLADLYDPLTMPPELLKAHQALDRAVDAAYGKRSFGSEAERVAFLFTLYQKHTSLPLEAPAASRRPSRKKKSAST